MSDLWVLIPAFNEAKSIGLVLGDLPETRVVVCDNDSTDETAAVARAHGADVVHEAQRGYGRACLTAMAHAVELGIQADDVVVFLDADYSDDPTELPQVAGPIQRGEADLVIGSRVRGEREPGALLPQARFGNWLATRLLRLRTGVTFTDLGPFRALTWGTLSGLGMRDEAFGWTVEMQLKAAARGLRCHEVPVSYRKRVGKSKITGTVRGTFLAGVTILRVLMDRRVQ